MSAANTPLPPSEALLAMVADYPVIERPELPAFFRKHAQAQPPDVNP